MERDPAGNLWACPDAPAPWWAVGSHLDSVRDGGRFDGALGVAAGFAVAERSRRAAGRDLVRRRGGRAVQHADVRLARAGRAARRRRRARPRRRRRRHARRRDGGRRRRPGRAARRAGVARAAARASSSCTSTRRATSPRARRPAGVVTRLAARLRLQVELAGRADHAGTTPREERHDALAAAARVIVRADTEAAERLGMVFTAARIEVEPNAPTTVPSRVRLWLDARAPRGRDRRVVAGGGERRVARVAAEAGATLELRTAAWSPGHRVPRGRPRRALRRRCGRRRPAARLLRRPRRRRHRRRPTGGHGARAQRDRDQPLAARRTSRSTTPRWRPTRCSPRPRSWRREAVRRSRRCPTCTRTRSSATCAGVGERSERGRRLLELARGDVRARGRARPGGDARRRRARLPRDGRRRLRRRRRVPLRAPPARRHAVRGAERDGARRRRGGDGRGPADRPAPGGLRPRRARAVPRPVGRRLPRARGRAALARARVGVAAHSVRAVPGRLAARDRRLRRHARARPPRPRARAAARARGVPRRARLLADRAAAPHRLPRRADHRRPRHPRRRPRHRAARRDGHDRRHVPDDRGQPRRRPLPGAALPRRRRADGDRQRQQRRRRPVRGGARAGDRRPPRAAGRDTRCSPRPAISGAPSRTTAPTSLGLEGAGGVDVDLDHPRLRGVADDDVPRALATCGSASIRSITVAARSRPARPSRSRSATRARSSTATGCTSPAPPASTTRR